MPDEIIKKVKEQKAFGVPFGQRPRCLDCGDFVFKTIDNISDAGEIVDGSFDNYCTPCLLRRAQAINLPSKEPRLRKPFCRYCWKEKALIGIWCRSCRKKTRLVMLNRVLAKYKEGQDFTVEDEQILIAAPYWDVPQKRFNRLIKSWRRKRH